MGNCVFRCGYTLYANTCIGRCIHNKLIDTFQKQFGENAVHSKLTPFIFNELLILPIPVLANNYAYMVADLASNDFVLVDVGDATLIKKISEEPLAILTTHKHWDHSGGNRTMRKTFPRLRVYGGALDHVPDSTHVVKDNDKVEFGRLVFTAMWTPGHTKGHTVWRLHGGAFGSEIPDSVFTGDHLMLTGCGAVFEGSVKQMLASLELLNQLPPETLVWPGHEMGLENLELAAFIEPDNISAILKLVWAASRRDMMLCTCPSTIGEEQRYNPFLRTRDEKLWKAVGIYDRVKRVSPPMSKEDVGPICFDGIIDRAGEMRLLKRSLQQHNPESLTCSHEDRSCRSCSSPNCDPSSTNLPDGLQAGRKSRGTSPCQCNNDYGTSVSEKKA